ncbi:hypothetical protein QYE76_052462 [Lolium multiflorum]|uniref:Retrotransposon Copia-like N-terminal domain-containing protein n=1 Tax=Lolium multiflorum TaxID=4521 RepID=A0AAD8STS5_LOLMU|nr:hypothetical protein QYE76_052462 [Lolium multiflorum]
MASSSSSSAGNSLGALPSEKLTRGNFPMWRAQVMPAIRGARRVGLLDGSDAAPPKEVSNPDKEKGPLMVSNPEYESWLERDQQVLSYILNSLSKEILMHVLRMEHAAEVWKAVEQMFASQSISKITNLRIALANTKKLSMSTQAFFAKMQGIADELAAAGKPVPDDELVSFLLAGLGGGYDSLVAALGVGTEVLNLLLMLQHALATVVAATTDLAISAAEKKDAMRTDVMLKTVMLTDGMMIDVKMTALATTQTQALEVDVVDVHQVVVAAAGVVAAVLLLG